MLNVNYQTFQKLCFIMNRMVLPDKHFNMFCMHFNMYFQIYKVRKNVPLHSKFSS